MQSSPPVRAWDHPTSPTDSHFSLDLGALGLDSPSNASSPAPKKRVDRVFSEDIDGPSDFTDNMMHWMRDGTVQRGTMRSGKSVLHSLDEQPTAAQQVDHSHSEALGNPRSPTRTEPSAGHHTPEHSPPRDSPWHEQRSPDAVLPEQEEEQGSSEWNPYAHSETPLPPVHKQFLQPTVEDYYSELTPAPAPSVRAPSLRIITNSARSPRVASPTQSEPMSPARASSDTLSPVRSPVIQHSQPATVSSPDTIPQGQREWDRQLQQLQARCQQLESINSALKQALDEEQRIRKQEKVEHDTQMAEYVRREREMQRLQAEASERVKSLQDELAVQRLHTEQLEAEKVQWQLQLNEARHLRADDVESLRIQEEQKRQSFEQQTYDLRLKLEYEQNTAEEASRAHSEQLRLLRSDLETSRLRLEGEITRLKESKSRSEERAATLEQQMLAMQAEQSARPAEADIQNQLSQMRTKIAHLEQQLQDEANAHDEEIRQLEVAHEERMKASEVHDHASRDELEAKQSLLNDAIVERDAAQDSLAAMQSELESIRAQSAAAQVETDSLQAQIVAARTEISKLTEEARNSAKVNAALDARISDAVRRREAYWRGRLAESEKERQTMAKALLRQWGREEVGVDDPQPFAFRYAARKKVVHEP